MTKVRIGFIGVGGIATVHFPQLAKRSQDVELAAAADVNPAARALAEKYGIKRFVSNYREILDYVDALVINTPTHLHADMTIDALRAGKHVFLEKPMTRTWEDARRVAAAARESRGQLQIGFVRRFDDEWLAFRKVLQDRRIGKPVIWRHVAASSGPEPRWFTTDEQGGGPFIDGCIHNYDFGLHTFGPAQWASASLQTLKKGNTAFDSGSATVRFASGDELLVAWTWALPQGAAAANCFEFYGPDGTLTWPAETPGQFIVNRGSEKQCVSYPPKALADGYDKQMDEFIAVAQGSAKPRAGLAEGIESMRVSLAVLESARTGRRVNVSEFQ